MGQKYPGKYYTRGCLRQPQSIFPDHSEAGWGIWKNIYLLFKMATFKLVLLSHTLRQQQTFHWTSPMRGPNNSLENVKDQIKL